jgi:hypothetical protein
MSWVRNKFDEFYPPIPINIPPTDTRKEDFQWLEDIYASTLGSELRHEKYVWTRVYSSSAWSSEAGDWILRDSGGHLFVAQIKTLIPSAGPKIRKLGSKDWMNRLEVPDLVVVARGRKEGA